MMQHLDSNTITTECRKFYANRKNRGPIKHWRIMGW